MFSLVNKKNCWIICQIGYYIKRLKYLLIILLMKWKNKNKCNDKLKLTDKHIETGRVKLSPRRGRVVAESPDGDVALIRPKHPDGPLKQGVVKGFKCVPSFGPCPWEPSRKVLVPFLEILGIHQPPMNTDDDDDDIVVEPGSEKVHRVTSVGEHWVGEGHRTKPRTDIRRLWIFKTAAGTCLKMYWLRMFLH